MYKYIMFCPERPIDGVGQTFLPFSRLFLQLLETRSFQHRFEKKRKKKKKKKKKKKRKKNERRMIIIQKGGNEEEEEEEEKNGIESGDNWWQLDTNDQLHRFRRHSSGPASTISLQFLERDKM